MAVPIHIAIIPDGNRRWARQHGLPVFEGHRTGAQKTLPDLIEQAHDLGVRYLTFWALSTENLTGRSKEELDGLFRLIQYFVDKRIDEFNKKGVQLRVIGDLEKLPQNIKDKVKKAVEKTKENNKITLIIALNYGGRDEILRAIKKMKEEDIETIDKTKMNSLVDTANIPDPELIIRTGGEQRLSGFMLWQSEYSELYFTDLFFPDFTPAQLVKAVDDFQERQRRFGK